MAYREPKPSLPTLAQDTVETALAVVEAEVRVVRAQISQAVSKVSSGGGLIGAGAGFALVALILLAQGIFHALAIVVGQALSGLILGVAFLLIGGLLIWGGQKRIKDAQFVPDRYRDDA
ncbi:phage holin family protein [Pontivivens insulae]|uniref:Phage holin family protein n=1 Tax=Pontivivens insulae TaxID=1639689 RepID=A0A2R8A9R5_9RHOB|nr:phage holin family protein [Pontivivens insulae]RED12868.1 putative superfamily III holin-X [Pontivivens insulae]SPF28959.1 hypothetical protein POI8812_01262 [Pontivivens insulae]